MNSSIVQLQTITKHIVLAKIKKDIDLKRNH